MMRTIDVIFRFLPPELSIAALVLPCLYISFRPLIVSLVEDERRSK